jgi:hypothetical protein
MTTHFTSFLIITHLGRSAISHFSGYLYDTWRRVNASLCRFVRSFTTVAIFGVWLYIALGPPRVFFHGFSRWILVIGSPIWPSHSTRLTRLCAHTTTLCKAFLSSPSTHRLDPANVYNLPSVLASSRLPFFSWISVANLQRSKQQRTTSVYHQHIASVCLTYWYRFGFIFLWFWFSCVFWSEGFIESWRGGFWCCF